MKHQAMAHPFSIIASALFGTFIGAAAMNSSQATPKTEPLQLVIAAAASTEAGYLPAAFIEAERAAAEQPLPAQF